MWSGCTARWPTASRPPPPSCTPLSAGAAAPAPACRPSSRCWTAASSRRWWASPTRWLGWAPAARSGQETSQPQPQPAAPAAAAQATRGAFSGIKVSLVLGRWEGTLLLPAPSPTLVATATADGGSSNRRQQASPMTRHSNRRPTPADTQAGGHKAWDSKAGYTVRAAAAGVAAGLAAFLLCFLPCFFSSAGIDAWHGWSGRGRAHCRRGV